MTTARPRNEGEGHDPSVADIPHSIDLQAVVNILRTFYPHLDSEEITSRLLQVIQGQSA